VHTDQLVAAGQGAAVTTYLRLQPVPQLWGADPLELRGGAVAGLDLEQRDCDLFGDLRRRRKSPARPLAPIQLSHSVWRPDDSNQQPLKGPNPHQEAEREQEPSPIPRLRS
jgi:hypothetical protein